MCWSTRRNISQLLEMSYFGIETTEKSKNKDYCLDFNISTNATYCCFASCSESPLTSFHAFHFARPCKSKIPGFCVSLSPIVACLYKAYNFNSSLLPGRYTRFLTSSAAFSKECSRLLMLRYVCDVSVTFCCIFVCLNHD